MRAILKSLLIHSAEVYREGKTKDWDGKKLESVGKLSYIRIEPSSRVVRDKNNMEIQLAATLFYCCRNSQNTSGELREDQVLDFQNDKYRIVFVEPLYDGRKLHHYEVGLVRYAS